MINAGVHLASSSRPILDGPVIASELTGKSLSAIKPQFSDRNRDVLMNVQSPDKLLSTLKSAVFGSSSSLPPLVSGGGAPVDWCVSRLVMLIFCRIILTGNCPWRESFDLPLTCHPSPSITTFFYRSSEVRCLLFDLDPFGGTDPLSMFPLFVKRTADVMAPVLV